MSRGKTSEGKIALNAPSHVRWNLHYPASNRKLFRVNYKKHPNIRKTINLLFKITP